MARLKNFKAPVAKKLPKKKKVFGEDEPEKEPSSVPVSFRLTHDDYEIYMQKKSAAGMTVSAFMREAVLMNKTTIVGPSPSQLAAEAQRNADISRIFRVVSKSGNNINQLAHRANSDSQKGLIDNNTYDAILRELEFISIALKGSLRDAV